MVRIQSKPIFTAYFRDITSRHEADSRLRESESRFRQLAETIQEVFWMTDVQKNEMLYVSPSYERIWGRTCQSLYERPISFLEAIHPEDRDRVMKALNLQGEGRYDEEYRIVRPDGSIRHIRDRAFSVLDEKGHVYRVVGIAEDVTDQRRLQGTLVQAEKLSAVGQLAAGVAHEINNPLGVILGFAQSVLARMDGTDPCHAPLQSIEREALRCKALVQNLLTFSRQRKPGFIAEPLAAAVDGALALIETQARVRSVRLDRELDSDSPPVFINRTDIQQVLINLCTNAMDAMERGGTLTVTLKGRGNRVELQVRDTGEGIPPEVQSRIFEPFLTTKDVGKGTGLGLSLAYEIIKRHRGEIEFQTTPGRGTTFFVRLPVADSASPPATLAA